ncbi:hypothetical protein ES705_24541 [subsurface metagenome]
MAEERLNKRQEWKWTDFQLNKLNDIKIILEELRNEVQMEISKLMNK